jgi:FKBP-type peptidyl-prolyl cis-trans isomerase
MSRTVRDRVFILVIAAAFLFTTIGVSVALIWELAKGDDNNTSQTDSQTKGKSEGKKMENFTPVATVDTLQTTDLQPGTGTEVKAGDTVTVDYTGAVAATGAIFQSSLDTGQPVTFSLDQVIDGWKEGMVGMKQGGKRRLLIPAAQAYGANPPAGSGIPANAALVFDITLHQVAAK